MTVQFTVTIPPEVIREAVRAELEAAMPDFTARLLTATALQTGTQPALAPVPVDAPKPTPAPETPAAPPTPAETAPVAPAAPTATAARVTRLVSVNGTTVVVEMDPVAGATRTRLQGRLDGAADWASYGRTDGFRFSKGGLAPGVHELRLAPLDANDRPVGDPASSLRVTIAAPPGPVTPPPPAEPPTPTPVTPPSGTRAMRDASTLPAALALPYQVPTLPATIRLRSMDAAKAAPVQHGHDFGPSDVPASHRLRLRRADGTTVALQVDGESRWPDGSLRFAVLSYYAPELVAGVEKTLVLDAVPGAQDKAAWITLADLAKARDLVMKATGWTWGNNTAVLRVRDAISDTDPDQIAAEGAYGIETKAEGPNRVEYRFSGAARRERDGAKHESVVFDLYVTVWKNGEIETLGRQRQPNFAGPFAGSTWKTVAWNECNVGAVECFDGERRLWSNGGRNSPFARTVKPAHWDVAGNRYLVPMGQQLGQASGIGTPDRGGWNGMGVPFGVSGNIPGGMAGDKPYWIAGFNLYEGSGDASKRWVSVRSRRNAGDDANVDITGLPAGDTVTFPLVQSHPGGGAVLADTTGEPYWEASYPRPRVRVALDLEYHCRAGRLIAPMDLTVPCGHQPPGQDGGEWATHPYVPNQVLNQSFWDTGFQGDNWADDRIGPWSRQTINWAFTPFDEIRRAHCLALSYYDADLPWHFDDPRSGRAVPVGTKAYAGLAAPLSGLYFTYRPGQGSGSANPGFNVMDWSNKGVNGYRPRYDPVNDGSHLPNYQTLAYLLTGRSIHLDLMRSCGASLIASHHAGIRQRKFVDPKTGAVREFSLIFNDQVRAIGWANLWFSNLVHLLPEGHSEKAYFVDAARENAEYTSLFAPHSPWREFGAVPHGPDSGKVSDYTSENCRWNNAINSGFQNVFLYSAIAMMLYRGEAAWKPTFEVALRFLRDAMTAPNGHPAASGSYFMDFANGDTGALLYKTTLEWVKGEWKRQTGADSFPNFGNWSGSHAAYGDRRVDPGPSDFITSFDAPHVAVLALADRLGYPGCAEARMGILAQVMATPDGVRLPRDRMIFGSADRPDQLGLRWAWASKAM